MSDAQTSRARPAWTGTAVLGALLLAVAGVGLVPMIREALAVLTLRARFTAERLDPVDEGERHAAYRCGGRDVVVTDDPPGNPPTPASRRAVRLQLGDTALTTSPVSIQEEMRGANRYWNRVVPFRLTHESTGTTECGVVYRLPSDTAAIRAARAARPATSTGHLLASIRGVRPPHLHGLRFRAIRWEEGGVVREQDFGYADWNGHPYGTLAIHVLGTPAGVRNRSLSYWPTLLFPVLYPLGLALLGLVLTVAGLVGRRLGASRTAP